MTTDDEILDRKAIDALITELQAQLVKLRRHL